MQSKHLDVSHVLMVVDPTAPHWQTALDLAQALAGHGVKTTLACVTSAGPDALAEAFRIPHIDIRAGIDADSLEWMLFLEMQASPDLIQAFEPESLLLPWRSPTVLHVPD